MTARVLFYVQHLKGIGHVVRAERIIDAMVHAGLDVTVAFGGTPVAGFQFTGADFRALEPIRAADGGFSKLVDAAGREIDDAFKARRVAALLALYDEVRPDVVVTEMFPLGRRAMRFELVPLIEHAASDPRRPRLVASVRDILQRPGSAGKAASQVQLALRYYDLILVHGDPTFASLEASLPETAVLGDLVRYTGFVGPRLDGARLAAGEVADVVVSVGGGAVGAEILAAAIEARAHCRLADARWLLLTGPNMSPVTVDRLRHAATSRGDIAIETFRRNLPETMRQARLSIQMAGYNTVADLMAAGCRAVLVPYVEAGETEQATRAARLAAMGRVIVLDSGMLSPVTLAAAIDAALCLPAPECTAMPARDGATESARLVIEMLSRLRR
ncbi:MAG: glycosyltransferase [Hyphomicrobiaceae bacterium]